MNIEDLREFTTLVRCKSFTKAAKKLYMSQSTLSTHIARIEKELGLTLIDRTQERFTLTPVGREFDLCAQDTLAVFDRSVAKCRDIDEKPPLRMLIMHHIDAENRRGIAALGADITFVKTDPSKDWMEELRRGLGDFTCIPCESDDGETIEELGNAGITFIPYKLSRACICASRGNRLWDREELTFDDIRHAKVTTADDGFSNQWRRAVCEMLDLPTAANLRLKPIGAYDNLLLNPLDDTLFVFGSETVDEYIDTQDGAIKVFREIEGKPLEYRLGFVFLKNHLRADEIAEVCRRARDNEAAKAPFA